MLEVYSPLILSNRMTFKGWQSCSQIKWLIERGRHVKPWHDTFLYIGPVEEIKTIFDRKHERKGNLQIEVQSYFNSYFRFNFLS